MTELEAVNVILAAVEEAPVGSLALSGLLPLDQAKAALAEASRLVQSTGWRFNTEDDYPLTRAVDGTITLPGNMLEVDVDDQFLSRVAPVQRGARLYDAKAHSYSFTEDLKGTVVFLLEWDELPQAARHYITIRAARLLQARSSVSESAYRFSQDDEAAAMAALGNHEARVGDHNMLRDSWSVASVLYNREML
jgi:hypothetical protein